MHYQALKLLRPLYCFGGSYLLRQASGEPRWEFRFIKPSGPAALPYVYFEEDEARTVFRLVEHHAHLYHTEDCHTLRLITRGADFVGDREIRAPELIDISRVLADTLFAALAAKVREGATTNGLRT